MKRVLASVAALVVMLCAGYSVFPDNPDTEMNAVGRLTSFDGNQWVTAGSGVAISPYWEIQVAHTGGSHFEQDGQRFLVLQGFAHTGPNGNADLILARVQGPVKYASPMSFRPFSGTNGLEGVLMRACGFGKTGDRTPNGWNILGGTQGTRRRANNVIDIFIPDVQVDIGGGNIKTSDCIFYDNDDPLGQNPVNTSGGTAISGEGGIADWDSGGGLFVFENNMWRLVATAAYIGTIEGSGVVGDYDFGAVGGGPLLNSYKDWILSMVPDIGRAILNSLRLEFNNVIFNGTILDVEQSDDVRLTLDSGNLDNTMAAATLGVAFTGTTTAVPATSLDIKLESKINTASGPASIALKNWGSGLYETLSSFQLHNTETIQTLTNIPAGNYVDANGKVDCRVRVVGKPNGARFIRLDIDQFRIDVR